MGFRDWLKAVDLVIGGYCGLTHMDIADQPWRDWYENGMEPNEAAHEALEYEQFPFGDE